MKKIFFLLLFVIISGIWFGWSIYAPSQFESQTVFKVDSGMSATEIADKLKERGIINKRLFFLWYVKSVGADKKFVSGSHQIAPKSSIVRVVEQLQRKDNIDKEKKITIIEGWRIREIADYLEKNGLGPIEEFNEAIKIEKWREQYDFLQNSKINSLEGFLFPDTYRVFSDAKPADIIKKMLDNFNNKITAEMRAKLKTDGRNLYDALILASIIEREALYDEDRYMISSIFLNRIREGIGLQSDATVNYVTGKKTSRPSYADLAVDSPYNTYKYRGLPPGPISNPGLASIKASIYPQVNPYYFFLTDKDGRAHFGKTYADHQANIVKYLD